MAKSFNRTVQKWLNKHGANLIVDGKVGRNTRQAIRDFQTAHGLKVTGTVNSATEAALRADPKPVTPPKPRMRPEPAAKVASMKERLMGAGAEPGVGLDAILSDYQQLQAGGAVPPPQPPQQGLAAILGASGPPGVPPMPPRNPIADIYNQSGMPPQARTIDRFHDYQRRFMGGENVGVWPETGYGPTTEGANSPLSGAGRPLPPVPQGPDFSIAGPAQGGGSMQGPLDDAAQRETTRQMILRALLQARAPAK